MFETTQNSIRAPRIIQKNDFNFSNNELQKLGMMRALEFFINGDHMNHYQDELLLQGSEEPAQSVHGHFQQAYERRDLEFCLFVCLK